MTNIVSVQYESSEKPGEYRGREYSYFSVIPDLAVGDIVIAPTAKGESMAKVSAIDVPESKVDERILPFLKTIEKRVDDIGGNDNG